MVGAGARTAAGRLADPPVAVSAATRGALLQRGLAPREVAWILVKQRAELRRCYRDIVAALPAAAFEAEWVKSPGGGGAADQRNLFALA
jgi:hypothetical protein